MMTDLKTKSQTELKSLLKEKAVKLREFRFAVAGSKTTNVKMARTLHREIAQILTLIGRMTSK